MLQGEPSKLVGSATSYVPCGAKKNRHYHRHSQNYNKLQLSLFGKNRPSLTRSWSCGGGKDILKWMRGILWCVLLRWSFEMERRKKKWTYVHTFPPSIRELFAHCTPRANSRPMRTDRKHRDKGDKIHTTCLKWLLPSKVDSTKKREWTISTTSQLIHLPSNAPVFDLIFLFLSTGAQKVAIHFAFSLFFFSVSMDKKSQLSSGGIVPSASSLCFIQLPKARWRECLLQGKRHWIDFFF